MVSDKQESICEILTEAIDRIIDEHGVVIESITVNHNDVSTVGSLDYCVSKINFSGLALK